VNFIVKDVSTDPVAVNELINQYHSRSTPTIVVDNEVIVGFDPERLDHLLASD
jgi:glutaredoxin